MTARGVVKGKVSTRANVKGGVSSKGNVKGRPFALGVPGKDGLSAYELALKNGFVGTEEEWLESLNAANPELVDKSVVEYLEKNPVDVPVTSVNGRVGDVELDADDVGAVSKSGLQSAIDVALAQAKESGEFNGKDGKNGDDGYTPIKGTDYYTDDDKTEMVNAVIASLPIYGGEVE